MKLLLLNHELPPLGGGAGNAAWFIAKFLREEGVDVHIVTAGFRGLPVHDRVDGVAIDRLTVLRKRADRSNTVEMLSFLVSALWRSRRLRTGDYDAMIAFFSVPAGIVAWRIHRHRPDVPYLVSLRGGDVPGLTPEVTWLHRLIAPVRRRVLRASRAVVANAPELASLAERADGIPVAVVPNGVDTDYYRPAAEAAPEQATRVLFVGRFHRQKNLFTLLSCFSDACKRLPMHLVMVGDGPENEALHAHAGALGCADRITWLGWLGKSEMRTAYQSCDIFVNPSLYEGMPNTVLEAMACGLAVVASNIGGNDQLVHDGRTGLLFDLSEPERLTDAISRLAEDVVLRRQLGRTARESVSANHSWRHVARTYLDLLRIRTDG